MRGPARLLLILALPLVIAKVLEVFLSSGAGRRLTVNRGMAELTTEEGVSMAKKYGAAAAGALGVAATALANRSEVIPDGVIEDQRVSTAAVVQDTAELLLATGALAKVVGDFLRDRERLRIRSLRGVLR